MLLNQAYLCNYTIPRWACTLRPVCMPCMPHPLQWLWQGPATSTLAVPWPSKFWSKMAKKVNFHCSVAANRFWLLVTCLLLGLYDHYQLWPIVDWVHQAIGCFLWLVFTALIPAQHQSQQHLHGSWQSHGPLAADYVPLSGGHAQNGDKKYVVSTVEHGCWVLETTSTWGPIRDPNLVKIYSFIWNTSCYGHK